MAIAFRPDFFIVGAPKCGTTALNDYLAAHPAIFMARKEQHFFGSDLTPAYPSPSAAEYFRLFSDSGSAQRRGEASVWYLYSRRAAQEIHAYDPQAQIIVMLRNPVDMLASLHSQFLYDRAEDIEEFGEALAAEPDRKRGRRIPEDSVLPWGLAYRDIVQFDEQLERYLAVFAPSQVHVILYDDLVANPVRAYRCTLEFLGVDPTFVPRMRVVNANKRVRNWWARRQIDAIGNPQSLFRRVGRALIPIRPLRRAMLDRGPGALARLNTSIKPRPPVEPALRASLLAELHPSIERLATLIGRDLSAWTAPATEGRGSLAEPPGWNREATG